LRHYLEEMDKVRARATVRVRGRVGVRVKLTL
jgi:hypothetical protein